MQDKPSPLLTAQWTSSELQAPHLTTSTAALDNFRDAFQTPHLWEAARHPEQSLDFGLDLGFHR